MRSTINNILDTFFCFSNPELSNTKVILLSSWKDIVSYAFYPTPPNIESRLLTLFPNNFFVAADPSVFEINNVIIAANTSDTLMDLHVSSINQSAYALNYFHLC